MNVASTSAAFAGLQAAQTALAVATEIAKQNFEAQAQFVNLIEQVAKNAPKPSGTAASSHAVDLKV